MAQPQPQLRLQLNSAPQHHVLLLWLWLLLLLLLLQGCPQCCHAPLQQLLCSRVLLCCPLLRRVSLVHCRHHIRAQEVAAACLTLLHICHA
jgi:hypothetical protein